MMIMQTSDAASRRTYLETNNLLKVIFSHESKDSICIQYHPKGIPGGMMPELDSHRATHDNPEPIMTRFSPWHACGKNFTKYAAGMRRHGDLQFVGAVCKLKAGEDIEDAAGKWEELFGVEKSKLGVKGALAFANMWLRFVESESEGLESITIAVRGKERLDGILKRASNEGLCGDGWINMVGVKWFFELAATDKGTSKL
jgi:hypothetical protein